MAYLYCFKIKQEIENGKGVGLENGIYSRATV